MITEIERNNWLSSLKMGNVVCYNTGSYENPCMIIETIKKITPKGTLVLNKSGYKVNGGSIAIGDWTHYFIQPYTEEVKNGIQERNKRRDLIQRIKELSTDNYKNVSIEKLEKIYNILMEE